MAEVPVLTSEKHSLPKADFSSSDNTAELPFPPVKALEPLFASPFEEPFLCDDMAPRDCSHTAHIPVCVLFQPMKLPEVPHSKASSFDLLRASSGRLLEENKDHQLFNAFLEPYWNSDRLFSLKAVLLCDSLPPVTPKKKPQTPPAFHLIIASPVSKKG